MLQLRSDPSRLPHHLAIARSRSFWEGEECESRCEIRLAVGQAALCLAIQEIVACEPIHLEPIHLTCMMLLLGSRYCDAADVPRTLTSSVDSELLRQFEANL